MCGSRGAAGWSEADAIGVAVRLFGTVFVAVYLLVDARRLEQVSLRTTPRGYRHDIRALWGATGRTLCRYLGGLALSLAIRGGRSALALYVLSVPCASLLGAWVSITIMAHTWACESALCPR